MDTKNGVKMPEIKTDVRRRQDERKGAGVGLLAKLGLGGSQAAGGAGGLAAGGGLLAGKAGVVALIMAGSSVAAGIGLFTYSGASRPPQAGSTVFSRAEGSAPAADSAEGASAQAAAPVDGVSSSLENFNSANRGAVPDPYAPKTEEAVQDAAGPAQVGATEVPDNTTAPSQGTAPPSASASRPRMAKSSGFAGSKSGGGSSGASGGGVLSARAPGNASNDLTRSANGASSALRGSVKTTANARKSSIMRGGGATSQLRAHSGVLRRSVASGNLSSQAAGAVMDGSGHGGTIGTGANAITGGGAGTGGRGVDSSAGKSVSANLKEVEPPPSPDKKSENKTPYQKYMTAAMILVAVAGIALLAAGLFAKKAKADPTGSAATVTKVLAGIATAAGVAAAALGVYLATKFNQTMQGLMFAAIGGFTAFKAAEILLNDEGGNEAKAKEAAETKAATSETGAKLNAEQPPPPPDGTRMSVSGEWQNGQFVPDAGSSIEFQPGSSYGGQEFPNGGSSTFNGEGWETMKDLPARNDVPTDVITT